MTNEKGKDLRDDIKEEVWGNAINFLKEVNYESIADVCWRYNNDGAITKIEVVFEFPLYLTSVPPERSNENQNSR